MFPTSSIVMLSPDSPSAIRSHVEHCYGHGNRKQYKKPRLEVKDAVYLSLAATTTDIAARILAIHCDYERKSPTKVLNVREDLTASARKPKRTNSR